VLARGVLSVRALAGRRARRAGWTKVVADAGALPLPPPLARSVSVVVIARADTAAATRAAAASTSDLLCFVLPSTTTIDGGAIDAGAIDGDWLARLAAPLVGNTVVAAAPVVVHPLRSPLRATPHDGKVRSRGLALEVAADAPTLRAVDAGAQPALAAPPVTVAGATAACLLVDRRAYDAAGALPALADLDLAVFELCRQLRAHGGEIVAVPSAVVVDHRPVANHGALTHPVPTADAAWRAYVEDHGPALMREAHPLPEGCLRIAVTIAAPSEKVAPRWGDWHLAEAFAAALRREGHTVRIQTADHADDLAGRACDVHCVIRGLLRVRRTAGQAHVLWIISHPESIDSTECDAADLILVASVRFADALRARTSTPVEVLLQATDPHRFRPVEPEAGHTHDVAIVAKSRDVFRSAVADAVAAGLRPAIYGSGWERFVDPALVVRDYVPNEELPIVYSSVGVLLNDHWETMREWGFVSNRLFDALACETPIISDDVPEIDALFAGAVLTYHDVNELRELVAAALADRPAARARAARGRDLVVGQHTFDHRARELVAALRRHGLA
jgi:glycosyltransferase involved in cell wall biosynthesis